MDVAILNPGGGTGILVRLAVRKPKDSRKAMDIGEPLTVSLGERDGIWTQAPGSSKGR